MCRVRLRKNPKLIDWVLHGRPGQVAKLSCSPQADGKVTLAGSSSVCGAGPEERSHYRPSRLTPVVLPVQH